MEELERLVSVACRDWGILDLVRGMGWRVVFCCASRSGDTGFENETNRGVMTRFEGGEGKWELVKD